MNTATHFKYEILRTVRNRRLFAFSVALPCVIFLAIASSERNKYTEGISFPLYFMTGMAAYGCLFAAFSPGGRIALDRTKGWVRQVRATPLRGRAYFASKVLTSYLFAVPTLAVLYLAGVSLGVSLSAGEWLEMTGLLLVGLAPFVVMGLVLGHVIDADSLMPAVGGAVVFFALFGGAWGRFFTGGAMLTVTKLLPSYWLVQAGKAAVGSGDWPAEGWAVVAVWTAVLVPLAIFVYRRDASRA